MLKMNGVQRAIMRCDIRRIRFKTTLEIAINVSI